MRSWSQDCVDFGDPWILKMSKQNPKSKDQTVRVDMVNFSNGSCQTFGQDIGRRPPQYSARAPKTTTSDFAYVNTAYVGSTHTLNENRPHQPPVRCVGSFLWYFVCVNLSVCLCTNDGNMNVSCDLQDASLYSLFPIGLTNWHLRRVILLRLKFKN